jgi:hypothetical protein
MTGWVVVDQKLGFPSDRLNWIQVGLFGVISLRKRRLVAMQMRTEVQCVTNSNSDSEHNVPYI